MYILVFKSHCLSLCLGFSPAKAPCRQRLSYSRREFSILISFIRLGLSLSLSLSLSSPAPTQSGPTLCCDAKLSRGLSHHSFTLSLSISHQILPCYECAVQVHLVTQTSPVSRGKLLHNRELEYSEYFLLLDTVGGVGQYTTHIQRLHSKYLNIRGRQS